MRWLMVLVLLAVMPAGAVRGAGESPVAKAARAGDLATVRKLIAERADVNLPAGDGSTALLWAAYQSDLEMVRALIAAGARFDAANSYGVTPLLQASRTGDTAVIEALLKAGANPSLAHPEGETPLMAASRAGRIDAVRLLLDRGAGVNAADLFQQETALMWAAAEGHAGVVELLLQAGADPNRRAHVTSLAERKNADHPTGGFTALMWAARNGHEDVVRSLAKKGADLNLTNGDSATAMSIAIVNDRFDLAATLLELGANANDGSLYHAVEMRDATTDWYARDGSQLRANHPNKRTALDLVDLLLKAGADPNKPFVGTLHSTSMPNGDSANASPFYRAAVAADVEALKLMIERGVNLEWSPPQAEGGRGGGRGNANAGRTPLMVAMNGGKGVPLNAGPGYSREGPPPFREPSNREPLDALKLLLKAGASPNAKAPDGSTLVHQAAQGGNLDIIRTLAQAGAKLDVPNKDGLTALDVAEGKEPEGARGERGRGATPPPAAGGRGRGKGAASPKEVAALLRELMGLPPAPPEPAAPAVEAGSADKKGAQ
jgi:ankyrin repeat protein